MALAARPLSVSGLSLHAHRMSCMKLSPIRPACSTAAGMRFGPGYLCLFSLSMPSARAPSLWAQAAHLAPRPAVHPMVTSMYLVLPPRSWITKSSLALSLLPPLTLSQPGTYCSLGISVSGSLVGPSASAFTTAVCLLLCPGPRTAVHAPWTPPVVCHRLHLLLSCACTP